MPARPQANDAINQANDTTKQADQSNATASGDNQDVVTSYETASISDISSFTLDPSLHEGEDRSPLGDLELELLAGARTGTVTAGELVEAGSQFANVDVTVHVGNSDMFPQENTAEGGEEARGKEQSDADDVVREEMGKPQHPK